MSDTTTSNTTSNNTASNATTTSTTTSNGMSNPPIFNVNEADMAMKQQALHSVL